VRSGNYFAAGSVILREMNATDKKIFLVKMYKQKKKEKEKERCCYVLVCGWNVPGSCMKRELVHNWTVTENST
jgi:hypothetical protein